LSNDETRRLAESDQLDELLEADQVGALAFEVDNADSSS
jgi:hypothetical protein